MFSFGRYRFKTARLNATETSGHAKIGLIDFEKQYERLSKRSGVGQFTFQFSVETDELLKVHSEFSGKRSSIERKRPSRIPKISSHPTNIRPISKSHLPNCRYIDISIELLLSLLIST
jgi:hypothetical protein